MLVLPPFNDLLVYRMYICVIIHVYVYLQANGFFFSKVIRYGKLFCSTFNKHVREMRCNNYTLSLSNGRFREINSFCVIKKTEIATDFECMATFVNFINVSKIESVIGSHPA